MNKKISLQSMKISCQRSIILERENQFYSFHLPLLHAQQQKYQSKTLSHSTCSILYNPNGKSFFCCWCYFVPLKVKKWKWKLYIKNNGKFSFDRRKNRKLLVIFFTLKIFVYFGCFVVGLHFNSPKKKETKKKKMNRKMKRKCGWFVRWFDGRDKYRKLFIFSRGIFHFSNGRSLR